MDYTLRKYQEDMVAATLAATPHDSFVLLQAATGAGKTIYFCELIKRLLHEWPHLRIAVLAHRGILVEQTKEKMESVWFDAPIGIASAGVSKKVDTDMPITIGTIQTLAKRVKTIKAFDLIIIDEVHRLPPKNDESEYGAFLRSMIDLNSNVRVLGLTATPFRLGLGYIYGQVKKPGKENWFEALHYRIGISDLQKLGFLCAYRAKEIKNISMDLKGIKTSGDYNIKQLSDLMSKELHVGSAVKAYEDYAQDRKRIIVFCVTIQHAELVKAAFNDADHTAAVLHSQQPDRQRKMVLDEFKSGEIKILCNVMVLAEGFDLPELDCIILCRPTKSPSLYVQMVGRGLRPHEEKKDILILDLANNCSTHGDPDSPKIIISGATRDGSAPVKKCPDCLTLNFSGVNFCIECGYDFTPVIVENNNSHDLGDASWLAAPEPYLVQIDHYNISEYTSKKGNNMLKIEMRCSEPGSIITFSANEFLMFDGNAAFFGRKKWKKIVDNEPPESLEEAVGRIGELEMSIPKYIKVIEDGKFTKVQDWHPLGIKKEELSDVIPF